MATQPASRKAFSQRMQAALFYARKRRLERVRQQQEQAPEQEG